MEGDSSSTHAPDDVQSCTSTCRPIHGFINRPISSRIKGMMQHMRKRRGNAAGVLQLAQHEDRIAEHGFANVSSFEPSAANLTASLRVERMMQSTLK